jgi:hypothetical protein
MDTYEIRVKGHIDRRRASQFAGMTLSHLPGGETVLVGALPDQAALHGVLSRIRDLGLPLLLVRCSDMAFESPEE